MKIVVFLIGRPGTGKDTQAELIAKEYHLIQVPSSQIIRKKFAENPDDQIIQEQKRVFDAGKLNDPKLVAEWVMEFVHAHESEGDGFAFSGSPRTEPEAEIEIPALQKMYGKENVILILFDLDKQISRWRITHRRLCRAHKHPIPWTPETEKLTTCPIDGSELYVRELDNPKLVDTRFGEYEELTEPTIPIFEAHGVPVFHVDASKSIEGVHQDIAMIIERRRQPVSAQ